MTHYDIVKKIIGSVEPYGDSRIDEQRHENLNDMQILVEQLIRDIKSAAKYSARPERSMHQIGIQAKMFLSEIVNDLSEV